MVEGGLGRVIPERSALRGNHRCATFSGRFARYHVIYTRVQKVLANPRALQHGLEATEVSIMYGIRRSVRDAPGLEDQKRSHVHQVKRKPSPCESLFPLRRNYGQVKYGL